VGAPVFPRSRCIPRQTRFASRPRNQVSVFHHSPIQKTERVNPRIEVKRSWAKKDGQTYQLATRRNEYVDSQTDPTPWTFEWVDLLVAENGRQDRVPWSEGEWELHLEYTDSSLRQPIDARFKLWAQSYNPVRDGAPN
jgi:hypothetical protein